jgi:hypothetical protein
MKVSGRLIGCVIVLFAMVAPAHGQESGVADSELMDVRHLELGDGYDIVIRRGGVEKRYSGQLVQMTDEWLVLLARSESRTEFGVPMVSKVPYAGRLFRNVGIGRATALRWLPREGATVVGRSLAEDRGDFQPLSAQQPSWEKVTRVEFSHGRELAYHNGTVTCQGDTLHYTVAKNHEVEVPLPLLGQLPGVGDLFTIRETALREEGREVALGSVLSVEEPAPLDVEEGVRVAFD